MKVALLAPASSIHTVRWANGLSKVGIDVHVISQHSPTEIFEPSVTLHILPNRGMLGYFLIVPAVKKLLTKIQPDLVNAHYASGYGTTARLVNYNPWILSVWGSDVYDFPYKSPLHKYLVKKNLMAANKIASTSHCMAEQIRKIAPTITEIAITPFGVDIQAFNETELHVTNNDKNIIIGTVKTMAPQYGIDTLIHAFKLLHDKLAITAPNIADKLYLRLVGGGPQIDELKQLSKTLDINEKVSFIGQVSHTQVPTELNQLDIYVALSRMESFGVAIIEAGAASRPVVVSDAGGLPEVTVNNITGLVVPKESPQAAADALEELVLNPTKRQQMGIDAKQHVEHNYSWDVCVDIMLHTYQSILSQKKL